ncbi:MAG: M48 family metallopeptidase [Nitrosomonas sp.]|nr:MAG: M48 family metallopeptidase [Nitrosomonas sp.]
MESVFFKILTKGIDYCEKQDHTAPYFGIQFWSNQRLHSSLQQVAQSKFNLGSEPQILIVVPTSPADSAGLRVNDKILEINGVGVQTVSDTQKKINEAKAALQPVSFTILRAGERQTLVASPVSGCKSQIALVNNDTIRTATDGETIQITRGLLHFAQSDEEIAAIISHQLAHNARKHHRTNKITGGVGGILIGSVGVAADTALAIVTGGIFPIGIFAGIGWDAGHSMAGGISDSQLQLADRDSLQLMATAGYETDNVIQFWQRVQDDASNNLNDLRNSHPFSQDRLKAMELAQEEKAKENLYSRLK